MNDPSMETSPETVRSPPTVAVPDMESVVPPMLVPEKDELVIMLLVRVIPPMLSILCESASVW